MDINKKLLKSINDSIDNKGIDIELNRNFEEYFFNISDEVEKDNIRTYIQADYMNSHMFLYVFARLLEEDKVSISFNKNVTDEDLDYLKELGESF